MKQNTFSFVLKVFSCTFYFTVVLPLFAGRDKKLPDFVTPISANSKTELSSCHISVQLLPNLERKNYMAKIKKLNLCLKKETKSCWQILTIYLPLHSLLMNLQHLHHNQFFFFTKQIAVLNIYIFFSSAQVKNYLES